MSNLLIGFLEAVEHMIQNPENREAVEIVKDGVIMWRKVGTMPEVLKFEADIGEYQRLVAARVAKDAPPAKPAPQPAPEQPQVQNGVRGDSNAGRMRFEEPGG